MPEVGHLRSLVAGEDAGEHEPLHTGQRRRLSQVGVADGVDLVRLLGAPGVAGRGADHRIDAAHCPHQGFGVEHVPDGDVDAPRPQPGGVAARTHKGAHTLAPSKQFIDHEATEVPRATDDEDASAGGRGRIGHRNSFTVGRELPASTLGGGTQIRPQPHRETGGSVKR